MNLPSPVRFVSVGIGNTALGLAVIFAARQTFPDFMANLIGYLVVVPISFLTHRDLSFRDHGSRWSAFVRYLLTITIAYFANAFVLTRSLQANINPYLAQTAAIGSHIVVTFLLSRYFVFMQPQDIRP